MVKVSVWKGGKSNEGGVLVEEKTITPAEALYETVRFRLFLSSLRFRGGPRTEIHSMESSQRLVIKCSEPVDDSFIDFFVVFEEVEPFVTHRGSELGCIISVAEWYAKATGLCSDSVRGTIAETEFLRW